MGVGDVQLVSVTHSVHWPVTVESQYGVAGFWLAHAASLVQLAVHIPMVVLHSGIGAAQSLSV